MKHNLSNRPPKSTVPDLPFGQWIEPDGMVVAILANGLLIACINASGYGVIDGEALIYAGEGRTRIPAGCWRMIGKSPVDLTVAVEYHAGARRAS